MTSKHSSIKVKNPDTDAHEKDRQECSPFLPEYLVRAVDQVSGLEGGQALLGGRCLIAQMEMAEQSCAVGVEG